MVASGPGPSCRGSMALIFLIAFSALLCCSSACLDREPGYNANQWSKLSIRTSAICKITIKTHMPNLLTKIKASTHGVTPAAKIMWQNDQGNHLDQAAKIKKPNKFSIMRMNSQKPSKVLELVLLQRFRHDICNVIVCAGFGHVVVRLKTDIMQP